MTWKENILGEKLMLHPSYTDLINVVNSDVEPGEQPVVQSRYSIVLATAKRARQLIAGEEAEVPSFWEKATFYCCRRVI